MLLRAAAPAIRRLGRYRDIETQPSINLRESILAQYVAHTVFKHAEVEFGIDRDVALFKRPYRFGSRRRVFSINWRGAERGNNCNTL